jgi:hypothetical protein
MLNIFQRAGKPYGSGLVRPGVSNAFIQIWLQCQCQSRNFLGELQVKEMLFLSLINEALCHENVEGVAV